jgi:hypothetical protein
MMKKIFGIFGVHSDLPDISLGLSEENPALLLSIT